MKKPLYEKNDFVQLLGEIEPQISTLRSLLYGSFERQYKWLNVPFYSINIQINWPEKKVELIQESNPYSRGQNVYKPNMLSDALMDVSNVEWQFKLVK